MCVSQGERLFPCQWLSHQVSSEKINKIRAPGAGISSLNRLTGKRLLIVSLVKRVSCPFWISRASLGDWTIVRTWLFKTFGIRYWRGGRWSMLFDRDWTLVWWPMSVKIEPCFLLIPSAMNYGMEGWKGKLRIRLASAARFVMINMEKEWNYELCLESGHNEMVFKCYVGLEWKDCWSVHVLYY